MNQTEKSILIPENYMATIFGSFDEKLKKIEEAYQVSIITRGEGIKVIGRENQVQKAIGTLDRKSVV